MSILVIGANGGVGSKLVSQLNEDTLILQLVYVRKIKLKN